jgi:uncharacterized Zn ribbon protein
MYKVEIDLGGWNETITIETNDFNKIALLAEFVEFQQECNWCEDDELTFVDEDGVTWVYDEDLDEWVEVEEEEEEEEDENQE